MTPTSPTAPPPSPQAIRELLATLRPTQRETDLQAAIRRQFLLKGWTHAAEHRHDAQNRFDFYLVTEDGTRVVVETKARKASGQKTERQCLRYALTGVVDAVMIVSTTPLRLTLPSYQADGKTVPVHVIDLSLNALL